MEKEFLGLVNEYSSFLIENGVDITKVRFTDKPVFLYDIENDIVGPSNFVNGKPNENGRVKKGGTRLYTIETKELKELCDDLTLGIVIYIDGQLIKKYVSSKWVLQWHVSVLDNILIEDNNWDYQYDKSQEGHTLFPSLSEMMDLIDSDLTKESGAPTEFVVINEKTFLDLDNNKLYY